MDPICLGSFNDARECLFKADGNMLNCKPYLHEYAHCQKDPADFKLFLEASTTKQKLPRKFDFSANRGTYDKHMG